MIYRVKIKIGYQHEGLVYIIYIIFVMELFGLVVGNTMQFSSGNFLFVVKRDADGKL